VIQFWRARAFFVLVGLWFLLLDVYILEGFVGVLLFVCVFVFIVCRGIGVFLSLKCVSRVSSMVDSMF
jgi:hypothetical protein